MGLAEGNQAIENTGRFKIFFTDYIINFHGVKKVAMLL